SISFVVALFFALVGIVCMIIPWSENVRLSLAQFIFEDFWTISFFGLALFVVGVAIATNVILNSRRQYYYIRSTDNLVAVDETVIQQYLANYWKQLFPDREIPYRLALKKNKIHISVDLPQLPLAEQRQLLERISQDLTQFFSKTLDYRDEFFLSASF